jgi:hypothetical protein
VNAPTVLGVIAGALATIVAAYMGVRISQRTTKSNEATAAASEATAAASIAFNAYDRLQAGQREELNRMQGQLDTVRPALTTAEALVIFLRAALAAAEAAGALQSKEIDRLHELVDSLERTIKAAAASARAEEGATA